MNKEEFILNIRPANGEPSKEYVMRLNTKLLLENEQLKERIEYYYEFDEHLKKEDLPEELRPYYKNQDCCRYIVELRKENEKLKEKVNQLETNRDEVINIIKNHIGCEKTVGGILLFPTKRIIEILERGKE